MRMHPQEDYILIGRRFGALLSLLLFYEFSFDLVTSCIIM